MQSKVEIFWKDLGGDERSGFLVHVSKLVQFWHRHYQRWIESTFYPANNIMNSITHFIFYVRCPLWARSKMKIIFSKRNESVGREEKSGFQFRTSLGGIKDVSPSNIPVLPEIVAHSGLKQWIVRWRTIYLQDWNEMNHRRLRSVKSGSKSLSQERPERILGTFLLNNTTPSSYPAD